jgi:excisionase family DNA binding protein
MRDEIPITNELIKGVADEIDDRIADLIFHDLLWHFAPDVWLSIRQLADYLDFSKSGIEQLLRETDLPRYKLGRRMLFRRSEVDEWLRQFKVIPAIPSSEEPETRR